MRRSDICNHFRDKERIETWGSIAFGKTDYLIKIEYKSVAEDLGNKEVTIDAVFSNFKEVDGIQIGHKRIVNREGKLFVDAEITEFSAVGKLDAKTFGRP